MNRRRVSVWEVLESPILGRYCDDLLAYAFVGVALPVAVALVSTQRGMPSIRLL